jgi:hypothetical protein
MVPSIAKVTMRLLPAATPAAGTVTESEEPMELLLAVPMFLTNPIDAWATLTEGKAVRSAIVPDKISANATTRNRRSSFKNLSIPPAGGNRYSGREVITR